MTKSDERTGALPRTQRDAAYLLARGRPLDFVAAALHVSPATLTAWTDRDAAFRAELTRLRQRSQPSSRVSTVRKVRSKRSIRRERLAIAQRKRSQTLSQRPICGAYCVGGHACQSPVEWDVIANRPQSNRCWRHQGWPNVQEVAAMMAERTRKAVAKAERARKAAAGAKKAERKRAAAERKQKYAARRQA